MSAQQLRHDYSYEAALAASQRVNWRVEDIIGGEKRLDFTRPFLPESLARTGELEFLSKREKLALNHIRGHGYLYLFGFVEEFILPFVLDHIRPDLGRDDSRTRAMLQFAGEEAKHIELFRRFRSDFIDGFGTDCAVIGPADQVAEAILSRHPLGVALVTLHIEWMTQRHYLDSVKDEQNLDPHFKNLLRHHWMEEAQHAKLDTLMVQEIAAGLGAADIDRGIDDYLAIGAMLDDGLRQQVEFDLESLCRAAGRILTTDESKRFVTQQHQANRWTFLGSGMTHASFLATVGTISLTGRKRIELMAPTFG